MDYKIRKKIMALRSNDQKDEKIKECTGFTNKEFKIILHVAQKRNEAFTSHGLEKIFYLLVWWKYHPSYPIIKRIFKMNSSIARDWNKFLPLIKDVVEHGLKKPFPEQGPIIRGMNKLYDLCPSLEMIGPTLQGRVNKESNNNEKEIIEDNPLKIEDIKPVVSQDQKYEKEKPKKMEGSRKLKWEKEIEAFKSKYPKETKECEVYKGYFNLGIWKKFPVIFVSKDKTIKVYVSTCGTVLQNWIPLSEYLAGQKNKDQEKHALQQQIDKLTAQLRMLD